MSDIRYFELNEDVGLAPAYLTGADGEPVENPAAGTPEPICRFSVTVGVPTMVGTEIVLVATSVEVQPEPALDDETTFRVVPDTRLLEISDALVANALASHPHFHEIESPNKKSVEAAAAQTKAARVAGQEVQA